MGHWFRLNKYNDVAAHSFEDGAAYRAYYVCGLIKEDNDNVEQLNDTIKELNGSFLRNIAELLSDYLAEKDNWKNFSRFWSSNKRNYSKFFGTTFMDSRGFEIVERFFKKGSNGLMLNDELNELFQSTYDSFNRGPKDGQKASAYSKGDQDFIFYRDSQYNTGGPSAGQPGSSSQNVGNKEPMDIQFPMKKIKNNV